MDVVLWIVAVLLGIAGVGAVIYGLPPGRKHRAARRERAQRRSASIDVASPESGESTGGSSNGPGNA